MTLEEIYAAEKKLRASNSIKRCGKIFTLDENFRMDISSGLIIDYEILGVDEDTINSYGPDDVEAAVYVSGYILKKMKPLVDCNECLKPLVNSEDVANWTDLNCQYFDNINRGKLTRSSVWLTEVVLICIQFFEEYVEDKIVKNEKCIDHSKLVDLLHRFICEFGTLGILANIIMSNYSKKNHRRC